MGWPGRAQRPKITVEQDGEASNFKELTMHTIRSHPTRSPRSASTSARIPSTSSVSTSAARSPCASRSHATSLSAGLSICPPAFSASRQALARIHRAPIKPLGHDVRLIPAQYVKPFLKGHRNDFRDAEAIAEAVQRPTMNFVAIKTPEQSDLLSLHRVRSRLVRQRTAIVNQIRGFLIERGITVRQGPAPLRKVLPEDPKGGSKALSPRLLRLISELHEDWRRLDARLEASRPMRECLSRSTMSPARRLMTVPGIGPIISSAVVAAIGTGSGFKQGRDFTAWLGLVPKQESTGDRTKLGRISKRGNKYLPHPVCASRPRRPTAAPRCGDARSLALDRAGLQALGSSQSARYHAR